MELVIISGKGGTGKTTIAASFAHLSESGFMKADCDVDASNLHLMFSHTVKNREDFSGAKLATIDQGKCTSCNACKEHCRFNAIEVVQGVYRVDPLKCEGCGACRVVCKQNAVSLDDEVTGETRIYDTDKGLIAGATMIPGAEGSGKLVTEVRKKAKAHAKIKNADILIDGSPGIGCAVIASIVGCKYGMIVTEPTLSGYEDFVRVHELLKHFKIKPLVVVNKYDLNMEITKEIQQYCSKEKVEFLGTIPFDSFVEKSINEGIPIVCYKESEAGKAIKELWKKTIKGGI